jgi:hypothetical protein
MAKEGLIESCTENFTTGLRKAKLKKELYTQALEKLS